MLLVPELRLLIVMLSPVTYSIPRAGACLAERCSSGIGSMLTFTGNLILGFLLSALFTLTGLELLALLVMASGYYSDLGVPLSV